MNELIVGKPSSENYLFMEAYNDDEECRVCRGEAEPHRRLFAPCKCSGSIRYVHSDCLMEWLTFAKRETCDLCSHTFAFRQVYAHGCPDTLPLHEFLASLSTLALRQISDCMRIGLTLVLWLIVAPYFIHWFYRIWFLRTPSLESMHQFDRFQRWNIIFDDIFSGLVLMLLVVLASFYIVFIVEDIQIEANHIHRDLLIENGWAAEEIEPEVESDDEGDEMFMGREPQALAQRRIRLRDEDNAPLAQLDVPHPLPPHNNDQHHHHEDDDWLFDVMGIHGPLSLAVRNASLFVLFSCAFLSVFVFVPHALGVNHPPLFTLSIKALDNAAEAARARGDSLLFEDFCNCLVGYASWCSGLVFWRNLGPSIAKYTALSHVFWGLSCLAAAMKLTVLLFLKVFALPFVLGLAVDVASLSLFAATIDDRNVFAANQMLATFIFHWVVGMGFIHLISVAVLQMREVLHPDILTAYLPPHNPHQYKFKVILAENTFTHCVELVSALFKYLIFIPLLVYAPIAIIRTIFPPLHLQFSYILSLVQVPFELALAHITIQDNLDFYAHALGDLQMHWTTAMCRRLGLVEFLLPRVASLSRGQDDLILKIPHLLFDPIDDHRPPERIVYGGRRLEWPKNGMADPSKLEYNLLPRRKPAFATLRIIILIACWWGTISTAFFAISLGPLFIGRTATAVVERYFGFRHDTFSFAAGLIVMYVVFYCVEVCRVLLIPPEDVHQQLRQQGYHVPGMTKWKLALALWMANFVIPLHFGVMMSMLLPSSPSWPRIDEMVCCGLVLMHLIIYTACWIPFDKGTFFNDLRIAIGQIQFHLAAYEDGVEENTDIHFKCFDVTRFQTHVLHPLCSTISIGIAVSFAISKIYQVLFAGFTHLTDVHVFRAAIATQLVGLLVSSLRTYITNSLQALHDAARDERYLIGKELTDMELHPKQC
ncbi:hypothetical protein LEN26_013905 [Aphanomyces euteiches]|nr:hypothetical protein LEN26_013905 [Aphanomyces euteiches]KAH9126390.1 hypothetical protein AeMF1_003180 [Aphanomyces euteiches]KAH9186319.1 hypothetical protein AeNC1_011706 [Aphanomyces euteiches]